MRILLFFSIFFVYIYGEGDLLRCDVNADRSNIRVAIGFFGMSRCLSHTYPTIVRHVFDVLDRNNLAYDVFWSTVNQQYQRNHSYHVRTELSDVELMRPCIFSQLEQSSIQVEEFEEYYKSKGLKNFGTKYQPRLENSRFDFTKNQYESVKNVLSAYYSQSWLDKMITTHSGVNNIEYDAVLILRPDTAVIADIDLPLHIDAIRDEANKNALWIPDFQSYEGYNDRLAFGPPGAVSIWLQRLEAWKTMNWTARGAHNTEAFLRPYLQSHNITVHPSATRVMRIRPGGIIEPIFDGRVKFLGNNERTPTLTRDVERCKGKRVRPPGGHPRLVYFLLDSENC